MTLSFGFNQLTNTTADGTRPNDDNVGDGMIVIGKDFLGGVVNKSKPTTGDDDVGDDDEDEERDEEEEEEEEEAEDEEEEGEEVEVINSDLTNEVRSCTVSDGCIDIVAIILPGNTIFIEVLTYTGFLSNSST